MKSNNVYSKISTLLLLLAFCYFFSPQVAYGQDDRFWVTVKVLLMDVNGKEPSGDSPVNMVDIHDEKTGKRYTIEDESGELEIQVRPNTKLEVSAICYIPQTVKVSKGMSSIEVKLKMDGNINVLGEAKVTKTYDDIEGGPERTVAEQEGNWYKIPFTIKLRRDQFHHDSRVVVQPILYNHTRDTVIYMRPKVLDRPEYNVTQDRLYGFDIEENDPLGEYVTVATEKDSLIKVKRYGLYEKKDSVKGFKRFFAQVKNVKTRMRARKADMHTYAWVDSIYKENPNDDCDCELRCLTEDYYKVLYDTAAVVAVGVIRPLRWLQYDAGIREIDDPNKIPKPTLTQNADSAKVNLTFPVGQATLDMTNEENRLIIANLEEKLRMILGLKDVQRPTIELSCTSSPEGRLSTNRSLADARMNTALNVIYDRLGGEGNSDRMRYVKRTSVASWLDVAALLRKDSLYDEANVVEQIVNAHKNDMDVQGRQMIKLPFYESLLKNKYLPQLRRVDYKISYTEYRNPTIEETRKTYAEMGPLGMNRYMYWQLYTNEENDSIRERIIREALDRYPDTSSKENKVFAHDLEVLLLRQNRPDTMLLRPYIGKGKWDEINLAHTVALLETGHYQSAMDNMANVPENPKTKFLHAVCEVHATRGNQSPAFNTVARSTLQNRVAILLRLKQDEAAYKSALEMPDSLAATHYLRAICINRLGIAKIDDAIDKAKKELAIAIEMDPELKAIAEGDADVNKLLFDEKDELYQRKQDQYRRLLEKDRNKPRSQNYVEHEGGKQWGPKWNGHHVIVQPD